MSPLNPEHCGYHEREHDGTCDECAAALRLAQETLVAAHSIGDFRRAFEIWYSFPELQEWWADYLGVTDACPDVLQKDAMPVLPPGLDRGLVEE